MCVAFGKISSLLHAPLRVPVLTRSVDCLAVVVVVVFVVVVWRLVREASRAAMRSASAEALLAAATAADEHDAIMHSVHQQQAAQQQQAQLATLHAQQLQQLQGQQVRRYHAQHQYVVIIPITRTSSSGRRGRRVVIMSVVIVSSPCHHRVDPQHVTQRQAQPAPNRQPHNARPPRTRSSAEAATRSRDALPRVE